MEIYVCFSVLMFTVCLSFLPLHDLSFTSWYACQSRTLLVAVNSALQAKDFHTMYFPRYNMTNYGLTPGT